MKLAFSVFLYLFISTTVRAEDIPLFAVASNMMQVITEIRDQYILEHHDNDINLVFGSSGNFARQILQGAPFELFLSANKKYVDILEHGNGRVSAFREFAIGRIGYFIPEGSSLAGIKNLEGISKSLINGAYRRIAIANPEFAPYGVAARQALQTAGLWAVDNEKLLLGENIAQAVQFTLSGGVDLGIIPLSYALLPEVKNKGDFFLIPGDWHEPIIEYLVLLRGAGEQSRTFYQYLLSVKTKLILEKYGYATDTTMGN